MKLDLKNSYETRKMNEKKSGEIMNRKKDLRKSLIRFSEDFESQKESNNNTKLINSQNIIETQLDSFGYNVVFKNENMLRTRSSKKAYNVIINSDVEKIASEDCLSGYSSASNISSRPLETRSSKTSVNDEECKIKNSNFSNNNVDYKEFTKIYLKVKFENLNNKHEGHKIPRREVWKEITKKDIPKEEWDIYILNELRNIEKYSKFLKNSKSSKMLFFI